MANFPNSISPSKFQRPVSRRTLIKSAGVLSATAAVVAMAPALATADPRDEIQKIVQELENLGCVVLLSRFERGDTIFVGNSRGTGCIPTSTWERYNACSFDMFANFLQETGRVQIG